MPAVNKDSTNLVTENVTLSNNPLIDALIGGTKWGGAAGTGATIYYSFPTSSSPTYWSSVYYDNTDPTIETYTGFSALNTLQRSAAISALQSWTNFANISIQRTIETASTGEVGDIRFAFTANSLAMAADTYAYAYYPNATPYGGDIWLNPNPPTSGADYNVGAKGYQTLLHEIGHALGLDHSFVDVDNPLDIGLPYEYEQYQYSVMSYSDTAATYDNGYAGFYPTTPMLMDIQAMQYLYGENKSYHAGDDVYIFNDTTKYYQTIWDAGGNDTIRYISNTGGIINLIEGTFSQIGAPFLVNAGTEFHYDNVAIAYNVTIENATGGNGDDTLIGNDVGNSLAGGIGLDKLAGNAGNDTLDGGAGNDVLNGGEDADVYVVTGATHKLQAEINDTGLLGIDELRFASTFIASTFFDSTLTVHAGDTGLETVVIGTGLAAVADITGTVALNVNASAALNALTITGNAGANSIVGGAGNDLLWGDAGNDTLVGGDGNDSLRSGLGNDVLDGGNGDDAYAIDVSTDVILADSSGIDTVNVYYATGTYTLAADLEHITLFGTAAINGIGNALNNVITGNTAANFLAGGAGDDVLIGGLGADVLTGSLGADRFDFNLITESAGANIDTIADFSLLQLDKIDFSTIDAKSGTALINDAFTFVGNNVAFSNVAGQLMFDSTTNSIYGDINGDSVADFQIILTGVTNLAVTDLIL